MLGCAYYLIHGPGINGHAIFACMTILGMGIKYFQTKGDIRIPGAVGEIYNIPVLQQCCHLASHHPLTHGLSPTDHVAQAGMNPQMGQGFSMGGYTSRLIQCPKTDQQIPCLGKGAFRGKIQPLQFGRLFNPPQGQLQYHVSQIGLADLRGWKGQPLGMTCLGPQSKTGSRPGTPCPSPSLIHRGNGGHHGFQAIHAPAGIKSGHSHQSHVNDNTDPLHGDGCLGNGCGQHYFSMTPWDRFKICPQNGTILIPGGKAAMEG